MAGISGLNQRLKPKKPLDVWSTREKLCLASAVFKIGEQNWVSVSRAIKPFAEPSRPSEWFHQKNCRLQYCDLMEQLEQPKRKRGGDKSESDAPSLQIMRRMTIERSEQLKKEILEMQQSFKQLKSEIESIKAGHWDDRIEDVWDEIQREQQNAETKVKVEVKAEDDYESKILVSEIPDVPTPVGDIDDSTQDSVGDISVLTDEEGTQSSGVNFHASTSVTVDAKLSSSSHLLSSLLISDVTTATGLQRLKLEQEQGQQHHSQASHQSIVSQRSLMKTPVTQDDPLTTPPSNTAPTLSRLLSTAKSQSQFMGNIKSTTPSSSDISLTTVTAVLPEPDITTKASTEKETVNEDVRKSDQSDVSGRSVLQNIDSQKETLELSYLTSTIQEAVEGETKNVEVTITEEEEQNEEKQINFTPKVIDVETLTEKEEVDRESQGEDEDTLIKKSAESVASEAELTESSMKDEALSPASSISSKVSEAGSKRGAKIRGRPKSLHSPFMTTRKSCNTDDDRKDEGGSSQHSDVELSEDDVSESEDILTDQRVSVNASSLLSESFPNSPASLSICSDTEEEKSFKQWKKSIMLVWRAAATHKFANVFLHPVTDEIAPGYHSVVHRPMDLSTIKKHVETGIIRSTVDFQHDMMLMFTNAIMYNSSDHNVFRMAKEMYDDVMQHIEQYVNTQMMIQTSDAKILRQSRRTDTSDKEDEAKKRKSSVDQSEGGGKTKKKKKVEEINT